MFETNPRSARRCILTNTPETDLSIVITGAKQLISLGVEVQRGNLRGVTHESLYAATSLQI
jgi:hypothetical protein